MASQSTLSTSNDSPKIVVHWLPGTRAQRLLWLLEECKVPYEVKVHERVNGQTPPEMKSAHPLGKAPTLTIQTQDQSEPLALAESGAIFEYLVDHFAPHLIPERYQDGRQAKVCGETADWLRYRYYMHYGEGSLMPLLLRLYDLNGVKGGDVSGVKSKLDLNLKTHLTFVESQINSAPEQGTYLCGKNLTAADILMCFPLQVIQTAMGGLAQYPGLEAYVGRLASNPTYKASIEKAEQASGQKYKLV